MKMICEDYHTSDYETLCVWWKEWDQPPPPEDYLPHCGAVVPGLAAGFLYVTDSTLGIIDFFISNPDALDEDRVRAVTMITETLIDKARFLKCKGVMANTQNEAVKQRAIDHGFKYTGEFSSFFREL